MFGEDSCVADSTRIHRVDALPSRRAAENGLEDAEWPTAVPLVAFRLSNGPVAASWARSAE